MREEHALPRLFTKAFGCQMSAADVAEMSDAMTDRGFVLTSSIDDADAVLVGTCTVREHAEHRVLSYIGRLRDWKRSHPGGKLIVAGCAAQRLQSDIKRRFPYVDIVAGAKSISEFPRVVADALAGGLTAPGVSGADVPPPSRLASGLPAGGGGAPAARASGAAPGGVAAFVTIMRGCNRSCSYCIVPSVRGRETSRPVATILDEVGRKVSAGCREVTLLGQTVNSYAAPHRGSTARFADLLRLLDGIEGLERVRFMSPHPCHLDDDMVEAMAGGRKVCPALHLPAQSGSDRILGLMRRDYTRARLLEKVAMARRRLPDLVLTTDIVVGFPTESEADFEASLSLLTAMGAVAAYCFKYSPRQSTEAWSWTDDVPRRVKEERLARLGAHVERLTAAYLDAQTGREVSVLTEEPGVGRARCGFSVRLDAPVPAGQVVRARVVGHTRSAFCGAVVARGDAQAPLRTNHRRQEP
ncbi:MAG: tRNA (N6-isopentenyl adenosine(37)-C2)-methylthiotransferase MiaB [Elusimicrobia bacterium]|nr:tRNA (N6-isopentenyl adenosine(37)-C2)-methylthiotransferase MiaB [Elusimicrobiota bacterium]